MSRYVDPKPAETPEPQKALPGVEHNGKTIYGTSTEQLRAEGVPEQTIAAAVIDGKRLDFKAAVRADIHKEVADLESIVGSVSDGMTVVLFGLATLMGSINTRDTLAEVKTDIQGFMPVVTGFLTGVNGGTIKLPHRVKGMEASIAEVLQRITAIAEVYETRQNSMGG